MIHLQAAAPPAVAPPASGTMRMPAAHKAKLQAAQNSACGKPEREKLAKELGLQLSQVLTSDKS